MMMMGTHDPRQAAGPQFPSHLRPCRHSNRMVHTKPCYGRLQRFTFDLYVAAYQRHSQLASWFFLLSRPGAIYTLRSSGLA